MLRDILFLTLHSDNSWHWDSPKCLPCLAHLSSLGKSQHKYARIRKICSVWLRANDEQALAKSSNSKKVSHNNKKHWRKAHPEISQYTDLCKMLWFNKNTSKHNPRELSQFLHALQNTSAGLLNCLVTSCSAAPRHRALSCQDCRAPHTAPSKNVIWFCTFCTYSPWMVQKTKQFVCLTGRTNLSGHRKLERSTAKGERHTELIVKYLLH